jgi:hypothetical protein
LDVPEPLELPEPMPEPLLPEPEEPAALPGCLAPLPPAPDAPLPELEPLAPLEPLLPPAEAPEPDLKCASHS